jgi:hypothetical protein
MYISNPDRSPLESIAETQPQLHPALPEIVGDDFPVLHAPPEHANKVPEGTIKFNDQPDRWDSPRTRLGQD